MYLRKFLSEETKEEVREILQKDCTKYLKEVGFGQKLYRGTKRKVKDITKFKPRQERKPRDTPLEVHKYLDKLFSQKFGWKARSSGVFVCADKRVVKIYGTPYVFFPIGNYKYLWSPEVRDLTTELDRIIVDYEYDFRPSAADSQELTNLKDPDIKWKDVLGNIEVIKELKQLVLSYKENKILTAQDKDTEIMFSCLEYYLVEEHLL